MTSSEKTLDPRLEELLSKLLDGESTDDGLDLLGNLLRDDPQARQQYYDHIALHAVLRWMGSEAEEKKVQSPFVQSTLRAVPMGTDQRLVGDSPLFPVPTESVSAPVHTVPPARGMFGTPLHATIGFFSQEVPFACLIATVIMSITLAICSQIYVTHYDQYARTFGTPDFSSPHSPPLAPRPSPVARITGMVDVEWGADEGLGTMDWGLEKGSGVRGQGSGANNPEIPKSPNPEIPKSRNPQIPKSINPQIPSSKYVALGQKFSLRSGLLEITYNTGAKVILQGPVRYESDSNGGFLSVGKLTGKLEKKVASAKPKAANIHHSSFSTHHSSPPSPLAPHPSPLFTIRTPTATITDLGTEFGVEVDKHGVCEVQVLQGRVRAEFFASVGKPSQIVELAEGEGRRYLAADNTLAIVSVDRKKFAEMRIQTPYQRWLEYSHQLRTDPALVAYYTFERHDRGNWILPNQSAAGSALDGRVEGAEWVEGRLPGKMALYFHGPGSGDRVELPEQERFKFTGPFTVAVWFKIARFTSKYEPLITKGDYSWRLQQDVATRALAFDSNPLVNGSVGVAHQVSGRTEVDDGRWHLAVAVYESLGETAHKMLYIDGQLDAEGETHASLYDNDQPVWLGGNSTFPTCGIQGLIDEVAIFSRSLAEQEIIEMFKAGSPANALVGSTSKGLRP